MLERNTLVVWKKNIRPPVKEKVGVTFLWDMGKDFKLNGEILYLLFDAIMQ